LSKVVVRDIAEDPKDTILGIFDEFGGIGAMLPGKDKVFIKINAVDFRRGCYTSPEILGAAIRAFRESGVKNIYVMDNSTQGNFTRLVFHVTQITGIIKKNGAKALYLDDQKSVKAAIGRDDYLVSFLKVLYKHLVKKRENSFHLNFPKLKTHTMTTVTLGIKNQLGFLYHEDRRTRHNTFELHKLLVDMYEFVRLDFTIINGKVAVVNGHYPLEKRLDKYLVPMNILIGGNDTVAVDAVGAKILGYTLNEVKHPKIAHERGLGCADIKKSQLSVTFLDLRKNIPISS